MIRYLLDTNVISELRKTKPHGAVVAWLETLRVEQIFLSAVTMGELQAGVELTRRRDAAKAHELPFRSIKSVADLDREIAQAKVHGRGVLVDFSADWCTSCREMERYTFTDPAVQAALSTTVL